MAWRQAWHLKSAAERAPTYAGWPSRGSLLPALTSPRHSAVEIVTAVEPHFEVLELTATVFHPDRNPAPRAWVLVARKRTLYSE
jgi:hypothetical protein